MVLHGRRLWVRAILSGLLIGGVVIHSAAQKGKLYPVDEGAKDASFKDFRAKLLDAARKRDKGFVLSILDPNITNSFGGDGGVEEFKQHWGIDRPDSELWDTLITILSMGGAFIYFRGEGIYFCAPYVYSQFLGMRFDAYEYSVIIGENVPVRTQPNSDAPIFVTLSYDIVKVLDRLSPGQNSRSGADDWAKIVTPDGKQGYVSGRKIRSPLDYRALFQKRHGKWVMTALVAGD